MIYESIGQDIVVGSQLRKRKTLLFGRDRLGRHRDSEYLVFWFMRHVERWCCFAEEAVV